MKRLLIVFIRWYQRNISAHLPRRCRYEPTCSAYAVESLEVHGVLKGTLLAVWRFMRCNQFSAGGVDFVPAKGKWPTKPMGLEELLAYREREEASDQHGQSDDAHN